MYFLPSKLHFLTISSDNISIPLLPLSVTVVAEPAVVEAFVVVAAVEVAVAAAADAVVDTVAAANAADCYTQSSFDVLVADLVAAGSPETVAAVVDSLVAAVAAVVAVHNSHYHCPASAFAAVAAAVAAVVAAAYIGLAAVAVA